MAVQIGVTLAQVCEHSLPQLELLATAARRDRAAQTLLNMQTNHAAIAACISQPGQEHFKGVQSALQAETSGKDLVDKPSATAAELRRNRRAMATALRP